jgi:DNA ligase-1
MALIIKQPMLSYSPKPKKPLVLEELRYPLIGFYKYDGWRAIGARGGLLSRRMKDIPNKAVRDKFKSLQGFDGELIYGKPTEPDCYHLTESILSTHDAPADGVYFYIFDYWAMPMMPYSQRLVEMRTRALFVKAKDVRFAENTMLGNAKAVMMYEENAVELGYEGIMLRDPSGLYKFGRSTLREQLLIKVKRFQDSEAKILKVFPREKNMNELTRDERGYAKRSSHKANKVAINSLGGFQVRDLKTKQEFFCGTGVLTREQCDAFWKKRDELPGMILKYRFQPAGVKELPRFPRAIGFRSRLDF